MKKKALLATLVLAVFGLAACEEETTGVDDEVDEIVGTWVSKGSDVAPGLVQLLNVDSIYATFNDDQTYTVLQYSGGNTSPTAELAGTYVVGDQPEGEIRSITLTQTDPQSLTAEGIFQVSGNTMQYEVVQTQPDIGAVAPTVEGGFGSTLVGGNPTGTYWVQNYDRVADM